MNKLTKGEKKLGRKRILTFIFIAVLVIVGVKLYVDHRNLKLKDTKQVVKAQSAPQASTEAVTPEPVQVTAPIPESVPEPVVEAPSAPVYPQVTDNYAKAFIYQHESGNCPTKWQGEYGGCPAFHGVPTNPNTGYGLCQSTPASKMEVMGVGWETSYDLQDQWCTAHAQQYGGWQGSYEHWMSYGNW